MRTFQNIQKMSHKELLSQTKSLVLKERSLHTQILQHLSEIKSRQLHLKMGFSSLFEYAVKELGYSEGAAYRRIQAMKLCQQVPETAQKIQEGKLSLSSASQIQTFFEKKVKQEREQKAEKSPPPKNPLTPSSTQKETQQLGFSLTEKKRILQEVEGNSTRDTMKLLAQKDPSLALPTEKVRYLGGGKVEIRLVVDEGCQKRLESLLHLLAHKNPSLSYAELLSILSQEAIQKHDPMLKKVKKSTLTSPQKLASTKLPEEVKSMTTHSRQELEGEIKKLSSEVKKIQKCSEPIRTTSPQKLEKKGNPTKESRYIPSAIKNYVWQRDGGRCNYMNHQTKRQCNSTYMLQVDHIQPFAYGGSSKAENLRLSCAAHNQARMALESSSCRRR